MKAVHLVLGPSAASLRRRFGPVAWCALEALTSRSRPAVGGTVATASVRTIADDLGIATNTALHALKTLHNAELVVHHQSRNGAGRFDAAWYRLIIPADVLRQLSRPQLTLSPTPSLHSRSAAAAGAAVRIGQQLALIPAD